MKKKKYTFKPIDQQLNVSKSKIYLKIELGTFLFCKIVLRLCIKKITSIKNNFLNLKLKLNLKLLLSLHLIL